MRRLPKAILATLLLALASCANNNDNAHTTATTVVPPPPKQVLRAETRPSARLPAKPGPIRDDPAFNPQNPTLVFNLAKDTYRENEEVAIDFSLANAKLKGDGGEYRVRYFVDDDEMQWIDKWEQVVLTGWAPGKHTIRLELVGPDGWPYRNGDFNVVTRELTVTK